MTGDCGSINTSYSTPLDDLDVSDTGDDRVVDLESDSKTKATPGSAGIVLAFRSRT